MNERLCPTCRRTLSEGAKFCTECGSRIDFQSTRKELEGYAIQESGLRISRESTIANPFYSKSNGLKEKISNPELKPLLEKKKVIFREWKAAIDENTDSAIHTDSNGVSITEEETFSKEEVLSDGIIELEKNNSEEGCEIEEEPSTVEKIIEKDLVEIELKEEATDFESLPL